MEGNLNKDNSSGSTSWRPTTSMDSGSSAMNSSGMEVDPNWKHSFPAESREIIMDKIIEKLQRHLQGNPEAQMNNKGFMDRLKGLAFTFENNIYSDAKSKEDYMRKLSYRLRTIEMKIPGAVINSLPDNSTGFDQKLLDSGTNFMQPTQVQAWPQLLSENIQSSIIESSAGFASALSTMPALSKAGFSTLGAQTNVMSNMLGISKNSLNNSTAQVFSQNTLTKSPRYQMQAKQPQQQQKQTQNQHHSIYQQQLQNFQQVSHLQRSVPQQLQPQQSFFEQKQQMPAHVQPAQQPMVQTVQQPIIQSSQQDAHHQTAVLQTANHSVQQSQQSTRQSTPLFDHLQQPVCRPQQSVQHSVTQQQQATSQQSVLHSQHQHMGKQINVPNKQQKHHLQQIFQHPNSGNIHQTMQASQALLQSESQESQHQLEKPQQLRSQLQSEPQELQQQSLSRQPHSNEHEVQHKIQTSDSLLQQHNTTEQYYQPSQKRGLQNVSSTSIDLSGQTEHRTIGAEDQQEMLYQKLQILKETYHPQIKFLQNHFIEKSQKPLPPERLEKLNQFLKRLQQIEQYLLTTKRDLRQRFSEDDLLKLESQIKVYLDMCKTPTPASQQHEGQWQLQLQTSNRAQSVQQTSSQFQQLDKNVIQKQVKSQASLVPLQHQSAPILPQSASMTLQQNRINSLPPNTSAFQQQKKALVQMQDHHQHLVQEKQLKELHPLRQQHPLFQQQQQKMQHSSFQQPQQVQHPSLQLQQQQMQDSPFQQQLQKMQHSSFQQPQKVQHPSLQPQQQQMQDSPFPQQEQVQHPSLQQQQQQTMQHQQKKHQVSQQAQINTQPSLQQHQQQTMQHQQKKHQVSQRSQINTQPSLQRQQQQTMQHLQKKHQVSQQAQINTQQTAHVQQRSDINSQVKAKLTGAFKPTSVQQRQLGQLSNYQQQPQEQQHQQFNQASLLSASSSHLLGVSSPEISQHFTPQIDKQSLKTSPPQFPKIESPIQPATSPCVVSSPSTLPTLSTLQENIDMKSASVVCSVSITGSAQGVQQSVTTSANTQSLTIGKPGVYASPLTGKSSPNIAQNPLSQDGSQTMSRGLITGEKQTTEPPVERLVKMIHSMSPEAFKSGVSDLRAVGNLSDSMAGSALATNSKATVGEDLVSMTRFHLQENNLMSLDSGAAAKKVRHCMSSLPVIIASSDGSLDYSPHWITDLESSKMLSTATATAKRPKLELDRVLHLEIQNVNEQLIETVVDVSDNDIDAASCEGRDGIVVKCSYNAMSFGRRMNSGYKHADKSPISPLWLLIPLSYPKCSPVVINRPPVETIKEHEDLSSKAKAMFDVSVRNLPEPMTLETLARTWDNCARNVVAQYAYQRGGGNFNSQYGAWEYCISA